MLPTACVCPLTGSALTAFWTEQADIHGAAARVVNVADDPIAADTPTVGEVLTAHRLGLARKAMCKL